MDLRVIGVMVIILGLMLVIAGWMIGSGWLGWFGRLPGDIRIASDSTRVYIPLTSMLLVSLVLTLVVNLLRIFR